MLFPCVLAKQQSVLMSVITGEAVASLKTMDDKQVLQQCMGILRELFKEQVRNPPCKQESAVCECGLSMWGWKPAALWNTKGSRQETTSVFLEVSLSPPEYPAE